MFHPQSGIRSNEMYPGHSTRRPRFFQRSPSPRPPRLQCNRDAFRLALARSSSSAANPAYFRLDRPLVTTGAFQEEAPVAQSFRQLPHQKRQPLVLPSTRSVQPSAEYDDTATHPPPPITAGLCGKRSMMHERRNVSESHVCICDQKKCSAGRFRLRSTGPSGLFRRASRRSFLRIPCLHRDRSARPTNTCLSRTQLRSAHQFATSEFH